MKKQTYTNYKIVCPKCKKEVTAQDKKCYNCLNALKPNLTCRIIVGLITLGLVYLLIKFLSDLNIYPYGFDEGSALHIVLATSVIIGFSLIANILVLGPIAEKEEIIVDIETIDGEKKSLSFITTDLSASMHDQMTKLWLSLGTPLKSTKISIDRTSGPFWNKSVDKISSEWEGAPGVYDPPSSKTLIQLNKKNELPILNEIEKDNN